MNIVGMNIQNEWMEKNECLYVIIKNNTNLAGVSVMSIVGMKLQKEWTGRCEWWYLYKNKQSR